KHKNRCFHLKLQVLSSRRSGTFISEEKWFVFGGQLLIQSRHKLFYIFEKNLRYLHDSNRVVLYSIHGSYYYFVCSLRLSRAVASINETGNAPDKFRKGKVRKNE